MEGGLESFQMKLSFLYFSFTISFLSLSFLLLIQRLFKSSCCNCNLCESYLNSTWKSQFNNLVDWYTHLLTNSPTQTIHIHVLGNTITSNPKNVEYMLKTNFDNFPKGKTFSSILGDLLGKGIFNVDGELWKFQRKMASLELSSVSVCTFAFSITTNEILHRLSPLLSSTSTSNTIIDLQDIFSRFSFDMICKISFGLDPGCLELSLPFSEFASAFDRATSLSARRALSVTPIVWKLKRLFNLGSEKDLKKAICLVNMLAEEVICQRRKLGFTTNHDLLSRFMASVNDERFHRDIVVSFLLAGRDTVASSLTAFFFLLSNHPKVVKKMRKEIETVMEKKNMSIASYDQLSLMKYVHATLFESLRLYPPVQFDSKYCLQDDVLPDGSLVRKNSRVTYHPYAMGRMRSIWGDDCHVYRPERWLDERGQFVPVNSYMFPVFQGGARTCLGKDLSLMEMKAVIVSVVREFDFEIVGGTRELTFAPGLTATVSGGLPVRVRRRGPP